MYQAFYEDRFVHNLTRYSNLRQRIQRKVEQILADPYDAHGTSQTGAWWIRSKWLPQLSR